jgi:hypothetical protein
VHLQSEHPCTGADGFWHYSLSGNERYTYAEFEGGKYLESVYQPFAGVETLEE